MTPGCSVTPLTVEIGQSRVLAKATQYGLSAKTFANRTQAERAAQYLRANGIIAYAFKGLSRPFYVVIPEIKAGAREGNPCQDCGEVGPCAPSCHQVTD